MSVDEVEAHNAALQSAELAEWQAKPAAFAAYANGASVTTWGGATLGAIVRRSTYRNNLGARVEAVTVRGTNGAMYHGRYGSDWSQLVRLRIARNINKRG